MKENKDPNFKFHMVYSIAWLVGGILLLLWGTNPDDCNLDINPSCPEQVLQLRIFVITVWCLISATLTIIRIMIHNYKINDKLQSFGDGIRQ